MAIGAWTLGASIQTIHRGSCIAYSTGLRTPFVMAARTNAKGKKRQRCTLSTVLEM